MHSWKLLTVLLPMSPAWWSIPHSIVNLRPLEPTYVVPSEAGQAMLEGEAVALDETLDATELAGELEALLEETEVAEPDCEADDAVLEVAVEETEEEVPPATNLAPQIDGLFVAVPRICFR
jgi:hypothetical protein